MRGIFRRIRRHIARLILSLLIVSFFVLHVLPAVPFKWPLTEALETLAYDARLNLTLPGGSDPRVVIVDIDEKSLAEIGHWPWRRDILAQLVERLFETYQVNLLGLDAVFPEPDGSSGLQVLREMAAGHLKDVPEFQQRLEQLTPQLDYDRIFARALEGRRVVLGYTFISPSEGAASEAGQLPAPAFSDIAGQFAGIDITYPQAIGYAANLPLLQDAALAGGFFNALPDSDGVTRRTPLLFGYNNALYESLALVMARLYLGVAQTEPLVVTGEGGYARIEALRLDQRLVPVDEALRILIPFRGGQRSFAYVSAADVINGRLDHPERLRDAIVLVGTTAQGLFDLRATPVDEVYPGVEVHANIIASILDQHFLASPPYVAGIEFLQVLATGLLLTVLLTLLSPLWSTLVTGALAAGIVWLNMLAWHGGLVIPLAATLFMVLLLFLFHMSYGYFVESHGKRATLRLFGQYVPPELVEEMGRDPDADFSMEGESRDMTVLFSDVRGFTSISEGLEPKELSRLMNTFLTPMTHVIHEHRGTIDKYMGDAIMAFWGAPLADHDHARHAVQAALAMIASLEQMQAEFAARGWPPVKIGVGLNTGTMSVGNMGSEFRMAYTVLGDAVNLGSRLEGLTKQYGVSVIISETTRAAVPEYLCRELDTVRVKGKDQPVAIFEPLGRNPDAATRAEVDAYHAALAAYRAQDWDNAGQQLAALREQAPQRLIYDIYLQRIAYFQDRPPDADWDGVYTHTTK